MDATQGKKRFRASANGWPEMIVWAESLEEALTEYQLAVAYVPPPEAKEEDLPRAIES